MSKDTKTTNNKNTTIEKIKEKLSKIHALELLFGVFIGIIVGYLIFTVALKNSIRNLDANIISESANTVSDQSLNIPTYTDPHREIEFGTEERTSVYNTLYAATKDIIDGPSYSQFDLSNGETIAYIYNTKGEAFMQDATLENIEIILNNGNGYALNTTTGDMTTGEDIDAVSILFNSIELINKEGVPVYEMLHTDDGITGIKEYRIDIIGEENIRAMYSSKSDEFVNNMMDILKMQMSNIDDNWEPHMLTAFQLDEETGKILCAASIFIVNGTENNNFIMLGYDKLPEDWEMPEDWYSYNADDDLDGLKFMDYYEATSQNITTVLYKYAEAQGWNLSEVEEDLNKLNEETVSNNEVNDETVDAEQN